MVAARIDRDEAGNWSVKVRAHEQTPAQVAELAEQVEVVLAAESASAAGVRLGCRLAATLSAEEARVADRSWLEGCIWSAARERTGVGQVAVRRCGGGVANPT